MFEKLPELRIPVYYLGGTESIFVFPEIIHAQRDSTKNSEAVILPNLGHLLALEDPNRTADLITKFLSKQHL